MGFTEPGDPTTICQRDSEYNGEKFQTCSNGCQWIFEREPEKYVQAWLPVHQIYQGTCGPTLPDVLQWYGLQDGDNGEYPAPSTSATGRSGTPRPTSTSPSAPAPPTQRPERRPTWQSRPSARTTFPRGPPGALRRRPARTCGSRTTHGSVRRRFRAPKAMTWGDFWSQLVIPAEEDPDFDPPPARLVPARRDHRAAGRPDPRGARRRPQGRPRDRPPSHPRCRMPLSRLSGIRHLPNLPETQRNRCGDVHDHRRATRS